MKPQNNANFDGHGLTGGTPTDTTDTSVLRRPIPKSYEDALTEVRFMCVAYKLVVSQRDAARANEKALQARISNLKATVSQLMKKADHK
jgi:uncharacterized protein (DUF3084 family)